MIAKRVPEINERSGKRKDVSKAYGLSVEEFSQASLDFLQNEGCDSNGNEYNTLHDWLVGNHSRNEQADNTPWQKGDELNDFSNFFSEST